MHHVTWEDVEKLIAEVGVLSLLGDVDWKEWLHYIRDHFFIIMMKEHGCTGEDGDIFVPPQGYKLNEVEFDAFLTILAWLESKGGHAQDEARRWQRYALGPENGRAP